MERFFLCFSGVRAFRGRNGRPGRSGDSGSRWGYVLRFKDVEIFAFSGMLHFQMFECFCFGLDDFAKFGKLFFRRDSKMLRFLHFRECCIFKCVNAFVLGWMTLRKLGN